MNRRDWATWADGEAVKRRAGGRRRYNVQRRRQAAERQAAIARIGWGLLFRPKGTVTALAAAFGVSPATISRDLRLVLYGGQVYNVYVGDELQYTVTRACAGGRVLSITDADDNEIRGQRRREIIRRLPRYFGRRR